MEVGSEEDNRLRSSELASAVLVDIKGGSKAGLFPIRITHLFTLLLLPTHDKMLYLIPLVAALAFAAPLDASASASAGASLSWNPTDVTDGLNQLSDTLQGAVSQFGGAAGGGSAPSVPSIPVPDLGNLEQSLSDAKDKLTSEIPDFPNVVQEIQDKIGEIKQALIDKAADFQNAGIQLFLAKLHILEDKIKALKDAKYKIEAGLVEAIKAEVEAFIASIKADKAFFAATVGKEILAGFDFIEDKIEGILGHLLQ